MLAEKRQRSYELDKEEKSKEIKKKVVKSKKKINKFGYVLSALIFLGIGLLLLSRYANITSIQKEITELEINKESLIKDRLNLEAKLEGIKSSEKITEDAIIKLGMNYPEEDQIAYVTVEKDLPKDDNPNPFKNNISKIKGYINNFIRR